MRTRVFYGIAMLSAMAFTAASASDLMDACIETATAEAVPEGAAGCECLVDVVGDDQDLIDEILALGEEAPEDRAPSDAAADAIGQCFAG